jgi:hypothetical protein
MPSGLPHAVLASGSTSIAPLVTSTASRGRHLSRAWEPAQAALGSVARVHNQDVPLPTSVCVTLLALAPCLHNLEISGVEGPRALKNGN